MKLLTPTKTFLAAMTVLSASWGAVAQTTTLPAMGTTQAPAAVGVTPQTAAEANRQAVPRSDTGTVVRTSPNAADSARSATGMTGSTGDTAASSSAPMRTARADRN